MLDVLRHTSVVGLLGMAVAIATAAFAAVCALWPNERRLAVIRPLSVATVFAGLCSFAIGLTNVFRGLAMTDPVADAGWRLMAVGTAESIVALVIAFGCLTLTWLCMAVALTRAA